MPSIYQPDLAHIHNEGYGFHWEGAAPGVLEWLRHAGIRRGTVVDLGCGGGQWLERLAERGYTPVGIDLSPAMIRAARKRLPDARLVCGSFADVALPPCDAVTSLGEPLNYLANRARFRRTLRNVARALRPGGLFVGDVRVPASKPVATRTAARAGSDWACIAQIEENAAGRLTRRITTFRRRGSSYCRGEEIHRLELYPRADVAAWMRALGLRVRTTRSYGAYQLGPRQIVFIARKPA